MKVLNPMHRAKHFVNICVQLGPVDKSQKKGSFGMVKSILDDFLSKQMHEIRKNFVVQVY